MRSYCAFATSDLAFDRGDSGVDLRIKFRPRKKHSFTLQKTDGAVQSAFRPLVKVGVHTHSARSAEARCLIARARWSAAPNLKSLASSSAATSPKPSGSSHDLVPNPCGCHVQPPMCACGKPCKA